MRLLLAEDDARLVAVLAAGLRDEGYAVDAATDGAFALEQALVNEYDAVVLDIGLPGRDGLDVCRTLRARGVRVPILMLTARDAVRDRIAGLDAGADDYLVKPFAFDELLARLRALLRRAPALLPAVIAVGDLTVDTRAQAVARGGVPVRLTAKEFALLEYLARNAGRVVGRGDIIAHVWDDNHDPFTNAVEVYVNRLRRKLEGEGRAPLLHTRRGAGYVLAADDAPPDGAPPDGASPDAAGG